MRRPHLPKVVRRALLSEKFWWILPTPAILYLNRVRLREPVEVPTLPPGNWSRRERHRLLAASEERLRNLEGKGPGLATLTAIVVAAVLVALTSGWAESTTVPRVILVLASIYVLLSLLMPLYLVGPLRRNTIHLVELETAAGGSDPEETTAQSAASAAMNNDLRNLRVANLLDAARRELIYALALLLAWVLLVPATGLLRRETGDPGSDHCPRSVLAPPTAIGRSTETQPWPPGSRLLTPGAVCFVSSPPVAQAAGKARDELESPSIAAHPDHSRH